MILNKDGFEVDTKFLHDTDKLALDAVILKFKEEGFVCLLDEPSWNNFGSCWVMFMERRVNS